MHEEKGNLLLHGDHGLPGSIEDHVSAPAAPGVAAFDCEDDVSVGVGDGKIPVLEPRGLDKEGEIDRTGGAESRADVGAAA